MENLIPISLFSMVLGIVWINSWFGADARNQIQQTIRYAIENGQTLTPETIQALGAPRSRANWDITAGAVLLALAGAFITLGIAIFLTDLSDWDILSIMTGVASFPGFVGGVLLWLGKKRKHDQDQNSCSPD
jgi:hypothetical protein